ncbi:unnamed protein product, partial [Nesidiocoris tenuis]
MATVVAIKTVVVATAVVMEAADALATVVHKTAVKRWGSRLFFCRFPVLRRRGQQCGPHGKEEYGWARQSMVKQGYENFKKLIMIFFIENNETIDGAEGVLHRQDERPEQPGHAQ